MILLSQPKVQIALATYNGERYLNTLLNSIQNQSFQNWCLCVSDDNSGDKTLEILQAFVEKFRDQVKLTVNKNSRGVINNFNQALDVHNASYIMLCDQDDVWLPEKIECTIKMMLRAERQFGTQTPILIHTDLKPVNNQLEPLSESFWAYQNLAPEHGNSLKLNLVQNVVTGCTVMVNQALLKRALPIPDGVIMHDWWLALVASAFGQVRHLNKPTILYRQHDKNEVGAKRWNLKMIAERAKNATRLDDSIECKLRQAQVFLERYGQDLSDVQRAEVTAFASLRERGFLERRIVIARHGFWFHGLARNIGWWLCI
jgi:glycosyltransferase involved in cell wall biosynthesis